MRALCALLALQQFVRQAVGIQIWWKIFLRHELRVCWGMQSVSVFINQESSYRESSSTARHLMRLGVREIWIRKAWLALELERERCIAYGLFVASRISS
jgi:hypothetical protein